MAPVPDDIAPLFAKLEAYDQLAFHHNPPGQQLQPLLKPLLQLLTESKHYVSLIAYDAQGRLFCVRRTLFQREEGVMVFKDGKKARAWNFPGGVGLWGGGVGMEDFLHVLHAHAEWRDQLLLEARQGVRLDWHEVIRLASRRAIEREIGTEELIGFFDHFRPDDLRDITCGYPLVVPAPANAPGGTPKLQKRSIFLLKRPVPYTVAPAGKHGKPTLLSRRVPFERREGSGILFLTKEQMHKLQNKNPSKASPRNITCWQAAEKASPQGRFQITDPRLFDIPGLRDAYPNSMVAASY